MSAAAVDIPTVYDVVINGLGYMFDKRREDQALLGHTPTFVPRNNTSGSYGDNEQDFFLTGSQKDWSGGSEQRHWSNEEERANRFWDSIGCETEVEGEIRLTQQTRVVTIEAIKAGCGRFDSIQHILASDVNVWFVQDATATPAGVHGAGIPAPYGVCTDGVYNYVSGQGGITKSVDGSGVWTTFAASGPYGSICYLNNQLYACNGQKLVVFSSTGVPTVLYTWVDSTGTPYASTRVKVFTYGSNLLIYMRKRSGNRPELWMYDGDATFRAAQLPIGTGGDAVESNGIVFLSSAELSARPTALGTTWPAGVLYAWVNGSIQETWRDESVGIGQIPPLQEVIPALGICGGDIVFSCRNNNGRFMRQYNLETGAVETIGSWTAEGGVSPQTLLISSSLGSACLVGDTVDANIWPSLGGFAYSGNLDSSLYDFGSSLKKLFRSIRVDFDDPAGTTVAAYYRIDSLDGSYTIIGSVGALVSGVDLPLPDGLTGNSISIRLVLTTVGSDTPTVRRLYVRAAPFHQSYRKAIYHLDMSSYQGHTPVMHRDGSPDARSGKQMAAALYAIVTGQQPVTVSDSLSTYTAILDPDGFQITQFNPDEFVATVSVREV